MVTTLQTEKNSPTYLDKMAGNMLKKCTFINPNSPMNITYKNELQYE